MDDGVDRREAEGFQVGFFRETGIGLENIALLGLFGRLVAPNDSGDVGNEVGPVDGRGCRHERTDRGLLCRCRKSRGKYQKNEGKRCNDSVHVSPFSRGKSKLFQS